MTKKDHLAALIQSLTPMEKKYFVQSTQLRSDDKSYMRLYKCVLRDKAFNASKLSKELKKSKANLAHEKEYLIEIIMKALRNYYDRLPEAQVNNLMTDIAILKERRLNEMSIARLNKAITLAEKYGRNETVWRLKFHEGLIATSIYPEKKLLAMAAKNVERMQQETAWMSDFTELQTLQLQTHALYSSRRMARTKQERLETRQILKHTALKNRAADPLFKFFQLGIRSSINEQLGKNTIATTELRQLLELSETHYGRLSLSTYEYFLTLHGCLIELVHNGQFAEFEKLMVKVKARYYRKLPVNQSYLDNLLDGQAYYYYMVMYSIQAAKNKVDPKKIKSLLAELEKNYDWVIAQFPQQMAVVIPHFACALSFRLGDYEAALLWNRKVIHEGNPSERVEVQATARMVAPILHAELKNYALVPSLIKAADRYLRKHLLLSEVEKATLLLLQKLPQLSNDKERKAAFQNLDAKYRGFQGIPALRYRLGTFLYRLWVERNLQ